MNENGKKHINALDILLILAVVLVIVAFFFRTEIQNLFATKGNETLTISFRLNEVDRQIADQFAAGMKLMDENGNEIGDLLTVLTEDAQTPEALTDGTIVYVPNGKKLITGSITAKGYLSGEFSYLNNGSMVVVGGSLPVSTGTIFVELEIVSVSAQ